MSKKDIQPTDNGADSLVSIESNFTELYTGANINDATAKTTPVDADSIGLVDSAASYVLKKLTWANLKASLLNYFSVLFATPDGWFIDDNTYTYVSATSFSVTGDKISKYTKGTKIKLTNDSAIKYYYVVSSAYSAVTTVTIAGETDLVSGAITLNNYSRFDCPEGFKRGEDWYAARWIRTSEQSIPDGVDTKLTGNSVDYDPNGNMSSYIYTAPISGRFNITGKLYIYDVSNEIASATLLLKKNSASFDRAKSYPTYATGASVYVTLEFKSTVYLEKGDTIGLYGTVDTTDNSAVSTGISTSEKNFLEVMYVGL